MLTKAWRAAKRLYLINKFNSFSIRHHTERLGEAMAQSDNGRDREYHRGKIYEVIHEICAKNKLGGDDMALIEDALNDHINRRVQAAYDKEAKKIKARQFVDERIKIKRVGEERET